MTWLQSILGEDWQSLHTNFKIVNSRMSVIYSLPFFWEQDSKYTKLICNLSIVLVSTALNKMTRAINRRHMLIHFTDLLTLHLILFWDPKTIHQILGIFGRCTKIIQRLVCCYYSMEMCLETWSIQCILCGPPYRHHLSHFHTLSWSLIPYTRHGPRPETSVSFQRIHRYLHTHFF